MTATSFSIAAQATRTNPKAVRSPDQAGGRCIVVQVLPGAVYSDFQGINTTLFQFDAGIQARHLGIECDLRARRNRLKTRPIGMADRTDTFADERPEQIPALNLHERKHNEQHKDRN